MSRPRELIAYDDVGAGFHHQTNAAAMLVFVVQPMRGQVVDEHSAGTFGGNPDIGATASRVNSRVSHSKRGLVIHHYVRRSLGRWTNRRMRAAAFPVGIRRHLGIIANTSLRLHVSVILT